MIQHAIATILLVAALPASGVTMLTRLDAQTERVPEPAVVNGVPQGIFVGRSVLTGKAVCLLFLSGGRITRAIPDGGLEGFDWARHRAAHGGDSGTWQMRGGQLVVTWGDGGVHQGPMTVNSDGIEFYGKRYAKPMTVGVGAIAGRWESARGTAITGGQGINRLSELVIQADGRYQWGSTTGGVVSGRAVASDRTMAGQLSIKGATLTLTSDAGTTSSHTFLPIAGQPMTAFSVDTDMFTRVGPAPAVAAPSPQAASPTSAPNYQGLYFTTPSGWTSGLQLGRFMLSPTRATPDSVVIVVLSGAERLNGKPLGDWLAAKMAADLSGGLKPLQSAPPTRGRSGAFETLTAGRTAQDQRGSVVLQVYYAITDGQQAGLAMVAAGSESAMKTHVASVEGLFRSLGFSASPNAGTSASPSSSSAGTATGQKKDITMADVAGYWGHSGASYTDYVNSAGNRSGSTTIAWNDGYELLPDGTYLYTFAGMVNLQRIREKDSGTWGFERGNLMIRSNTGRKPKEYYILGYQVAPDGVVFMTVLDVYYPRTKENIEMWAEKWVKKGK